MDEWMELGIAAATNHETHSEQISTLTERLNTRTGHLFVRGIVVFRSSSSGFHPHTFTNRKDIPSQNSDRKTHNIQN
jgi:hypothetical protein